MKTGSIVGLFIIVACLGIWAQQPPQDPNKHIEGARELFYLAVAQKDTLPPIRKTAQKKPSTPTTTSAVVQPPPPDSPPPPKENSGAVHLGLRYNLVLVDRNSGKSEDIDPDRVLRRGECFALDFETNRSGYLYVLAKQSSGQWLPLLPSAEMPDESNIIDPGKRVRVPKTHCFEVGDPPGSENLFVVLSRDPRDFYDLYDEIKHKNSAPPANPQVNNVQYADASMDKTVKDMAQQFGTRDIAIRKVSQPVTAKEAPNSVYVVNSSDRPSSSVATQIEVKHR